MKNQPNLDLLRSIAVALVVTEHELLAMHHHWVGRWDLSWMGVVGVFIFFVHTSLVLMWSLERRPHLLDFYIRRVFRIYPLAVVTILVTVIFRIPTMHNPNGDTYFGMPSIPTLIANLLQLQNLRGPVIYGVMWTLPLELAMYFLLPFLFFLLRATFAVWPIVCLWIGIVVYAQQMFPGNNATFVACIPYFLAGVIAYVLFAKVRPVLPAFLMPVLVCALFCLFMTAPDFHKAWGLTMALGLTLPFFRQIRAAWLIRSSEQVARHSYSMYLMHPFSVAISVNLLAGHSMILRIAALFVSLLLFSVLAYRFIEKPMIRYGAKLASRMGKQDLAAAAVYA